MNKTTIVTFLRTHLPNPPLFKISIEKEQISKRAKQVAIGIVGGAALVGVAAGINHFAEVNKKPASLTFGEHISKNAKGIAIDSVIYTLFGLAIIALVK